MRKRIFLTYEYLYDEYYDCVICPNNEILKCSTTNRNGYRDFKSDSEKCVGSPYLQQCTKSKAHQKTVTKHIRSSYIELAEDHMHTQKYKEIYEKRREA